MRTDRKQEILDINQIIFDLALNACRKQILVFSKQLKNKMLETGITRPVTEGIIKEAFRGYKTMETFHDQCMETMYEILEAYLRPNNRSKDVLGRLVVEYSLFRALKKPLLYPEESPEDTASRKRFVRTVLARPFLNYFLVAVRGSMDDIDQFDARPVLFGTENPVMAERRELAMAIRDEYITRYTHGKRVVNWNGIYDDPRSMRLGFELIADVLESMRSLGDPRMLKIVQNIQGMDKPVSEKNVMGREFVMDDVRLLKAALVRGYEMLAEVLGMNREEDQD